MDEWSGDENKTPFLKKKWADQMKSLSVRLRLIFIGLAIFSYAEVWGVDWKLYYFHKNFTAYYDAQGITRPSKNIVRVWTRKDFSEEGVLDVVRELGKEYKNFSHIDSLMEINCFEKKSHSLSANHYDNKGRTIFYDSSPSEWYFIVPDSVAERLYEEVCE